MPGARRNIAIPRRKIGRSRGLGKRYTLGIIKKSKRSYYTSQFGGKRSMSRRTHDFKGLPNPANPRRKRRSGPPTPWSQLKKRYRGTAARKSLKRKGLWYPTPRSSRAAWKDIEASFENRNPALKPVRKSTGWLNGPAGTNTQIKFKKNRGKTEVYIRRKARTNSASGAKKAREYHAEKMRKTGRYNTGQYRNVGGFVDASGEFHPIRDSEGYNYAGVIAKKKRAAARKRAPAKRKTSTRKRR